MPSAPPRVIYEDDALVAIDKPGGLLAHGDAGDRTALGWAQGREVQLGRDPTALHLVHRLDRETSGVLLFARAEAAAVVNAAFRAHQVLKVYLAACSPVPAQRWQRVDHQLVARRHGRGERMCVVADGGVQASCEIEVLARGRRFAAVRVIADQGRKHQVRVALASIGSPIAGDFLYGGALSRQLAPRIMLHARTIELRHPLSGAHLTLRAPVPGDLRLLFADDGVALPPDLDVRHRGAAPQRGRH